LLKRLTPDQPAAVLCLSYPLSLFRGWERARVRVLLFILSDELVGHGRRPVIDRHAIPVVGHIQDKVLAHDPEADETNVSGRL
jgi:hypothetical protein